MAVAKYNSKAKVNTITTLGGGIKWKLNAIGMTAFAHGSKHFVSRSEVKRMLESGISQNFHGSQLYADGEVLLSNWRFSVSEAGRANFGCMLFSKSATETLRKWAQVD